MTDYVSIIQERNRLRLEAGMPDYAVEQLEKYSLAKEAYARQNFVAEFISPHTVELDALMCKAQTWEQFQALREGYSEIEDHYKPEITEAWTAKLHDGTWEIYADEFEYEY